MSRQMLLGCFEGDLSPQRSPWQQLERQQEKRRSIRSSSDLQRPTPPPQEFSRVTGYHNAFAADEEEQEEPTDLERVESDAQASTLLPSARPQSVVILDAKSNLPHPNEGREKLPGYTCTITAGCPVDMKLERVSPFDAVSEPQWVRVYVVLRGTLLRVHTVRPAGLLAKAPKTLGSADGPGRLLRTYTMQYAEVGLASDHPKVEMIPRSPITQLLPASTLSRLRETEPHLFELTRQYVIRLRVETEQILLRFKTSEERHNWIHYLCAAVDIAPPLDDRTEPRFHTIPRRRRPRPVPEADESSPSDNAAAIAEQEMILRTHYPNLAGGAMVMPQGADANGAHEDPDSQPTTPEPRARPCLLDPAATDVSSSPRVVALLGPGRTSQDLTRSQHVPGLVPSNRALPRRRANSVTPSPTSVSTVAQRPTSMVITGSVFGSAFMRYLDPTSSAQASGQGTTPSVGQMASVGARLDQPRPSTALGISRVDSEFSEARATAAAASSSQETVAPAGEEDQKWHSNIRLDPVLEARFRRRCLPALLFHSRRAGEFIVSNGQRCRIDWQDQTLKLAAALPPAYGEDEPDGNLGLTPTSSHLGTTQSTTRPSMDNVRPRAITMASATARSSIDLVRRRLGRAGTTSDLPKAQPSTSHSRRNSVEMSQARPSMSRAASSAGRSSIDLFRRLGRSNTNNNVANRDVEGDAIPLESSTLPSATHGSDNVETDRPIRPCGYRTSSGTARSSMDFVRNRLQRTNTNTSSTSFATGLGLSRYTCIGGSSTVVADSNDGPRPHFEMSQFRPRAHRQLSTSQTTARSSMDVVHRRLRRSSTATSITSNGDGAVYTPPTAFTTATSTARESTDVARSEMSQIQRVTSSSAGSIRQDSIFTAEATDADGSPTTTYSPSPRARARRPPPSAWKSWTRLRSNSSQDMNIASIDAQNVAISSDGDDADADADADDIELSHHTTAVVVGSRPTRAANARPLSWLKRASMDVEIDSEALPGGSPGGGNVQGSRMSWLKTKSAAMTADASDELAHVQAVSAVPDTQMSRPSRPLSWLVRAASGTSHAGSHTSTAHTAKPVLRARSGGGCTGFGF